MAGQPGRKKTGGREKGTPNKRTNKMLQKLAESGLTPLEFFLGTMRDEDADMEDRMWAAAHAAPYIHPRLQNLQVHGAPEGDLPPVRMEIEVKNGNGFIPGTSKPGD